MADATAGAAAGATAGATAEATGGATGASPAQPGRQWEQVDLLSAIGGVVDGAPAPVVEPPPVAGVPGLPESQPQEVVAPEVAPLLEFADESRPGPAEAAGVDSGVEPQVEPRPEPGVDSVLHPEADAGQASRPGPALDSAFDPGADPGPAGTTPPGRPAPLDAQTPLETVPALDPAAGAAARALAPAAVSRRNEPPAPQPSRLLILDTETTGLSPADASCIEVGAVLFAVPQRAVLMQVSFLMPCDANPAAAINRIEAATTRLSQPWRAGLACFLAMVEDCDVVVAHNAAFDRQWFGHGHLPSLPRPWICSMEDIRWPAERQLRATPSVRDLALAYDIPVWAAHRALTDCIYLAQVFSRCDDLESLLAAALEPRRLYRACLSYEERHRAREAGFRWNDPVPRAWSRRLSEREATALPFPVEAVAA